MHNVNQRNWELEKIKGAIVATTYTAPEVFALSVGPALLLCHSITTESTLLECTRYDRADGVAWTMLEVTQLFKQLADDDVFAVPTDILPVLPRLPNLNVSVANIVLGLIQGAGEGLLVWSLTRYKAPRVSRPMEHVDITMLREAVARLMREKHISQERFAKQAGDMSIATFAGFLNNKMDSREATVAKIRRALEFFQGNQS